MTRNKAVPSPENRREERAPITPAARARSLGLWGTFGLILAFQGAPKPDFAQAEKMLALLRSAAAGPVLAADVEAVLAEEGAELILEQQNITRKVTRDQYRAVLAALGKPDPPDLSPAEPGERARRGVEGLLKNVWPALNWGRTHTELLARRLDELRKADLAAGARALAFRFLPEPVEIAPRLFAVMGGRAGAAALSGDRIYFDILATSFYAETGTLAAYPALPYIGEFFAHEIHHLGLARILERRRARLALSGREERAYDFLSALVLEGGATYLISAHRSADEMRGDPQFKAYFAREGEMFAACQDVLRKILESELTGEAYEKAVAPLAGSGWHALGGKMLAAIDRAGGLERVLGVLGDPARLLRDYNAAVADAAAGAFRFDPALAEEVSRLGRR